MVARYIVIGAQYFDRDGEVGGGAVYVHEPARQMNNAKPIRQWNSRFYVLALSSKKY